MVKRIVFLLLADGVFTKRVESAGFCNNLHTISLFEREEGREGGERARERERERERAREGDKAREKKREREREREREDLM